MRTTQLDDELEPKWPSFGTPGAGAFWKQVRFRKILAVETIHDLLCHSWTLLSQFVTVRG
jgi:hypothetical protein